MVFLDTSAIYALADTADPNHRRATELMMRLVGSDESILVHNYVISESAALLQRRLGLEPTLRFLDQASRLEIHWIVPEDHEEAVELLNTRSRRRLSLVDCASFAVMRKLGVTLAFAFDADFEAEGFQLYRA